MVVLAKTLTRSLRSRISILVLCTSILVAGKGVFHSLHSFHHFSDLFFPNSSGYENLDWSLQWLEDHDNSSAKANKPVVQEEYGVARDDTTYKRQDVYDQWHSYILSSEAINGDMTWGSLIVDGDCPGTDTYAICSTDADYGDIVTNWVTQMNGKS